MLTFIIILIVLCAICSSHGENTNNNQKKSSSKNSKNSKAYDYSMSRRQIKKMEKQARKRQAQLEEDAWEDAMTDFIGWFG